MAVKAALGVAALAVAAGLYVWWRLRRKRERKCTVLFDDLYFAEGPRWRAGHLYFSDFGSSRVYAVDWRTKQRREVVEVPDAQDLCRGPSGLGWRPDGTLLVTQMRTRRLLAFKPDGQQPAEAAELGEIATGHCNDLVVDTSGAAYVGNFGFELEPVERAFELGAPPEKVLELIRPTSLARVDASGKVTAATPPELTFPNGIVITPDGKTLLVAETFGHRVSAYTRAADGSLSERQTWVELPMCSPDGMCLDRDGALWIALAGKQVFVRVAPGGALVDYIPATEGFTAVACMLGGFDGRTLFMLEARASDAEKVKANGPGNSRIVTAQVDVPGATSPDAPHYFAGYC